MKEKFYYHRDRENKPRVTVCVMESDVGNPIVQGVALCSWKDNPRKATGRAIARGRALKALYHLESNDRILRDEAISVLTECDGIDQVLCYKSAYLR